MLLASPTKTQRAWSSTFLALLCQMATLLDGAGVSPRVVHTLMRHSTLELTGRYTRPRVVDLEAAASLPSLRPDPAPAEPAALSKTGTDVQDIKGRFPHRRGRNRADSDAIMPSDEAILMSRKPLDLSEVSGLSRPVSGADGTSGDWIRTSDLRVMNPLLLTN